MLLVILPVVLFVQNQTEFSSGSGVFAQEQTARPKLEKRSYTPVIASSKVLVTGCEIANQQYETLSVAGEPFDFDVATNPDVNLGVRGYAPATAALQLVELGPVHDPKAPQFATMFANERTPTFSNAYQRYRWDEDCDCPTDTFSPWETTVLGMAVSPGEVIRVPDSGHDIGGGRDVMVLYAEETRITFHVGREDSMAGYVMHIEDVCIEPDLLALYRATNAAGRNELPALTGRQPFGRASGNEIKIAVRDTGHFLDPRSRNDWWQGR
jgi:hypothetical protein